MKLSNIIIIFLLIILFISIFLNNNTNNTFDYDNLQKNYSIVEKNNNIDLEYMTVSNMMKNIIDKPITSYKDVKSFELTKGVPINNMYDVQPGLYDEQDLPKKNIEMPIGEKINATLEMVSQEQAKKVEYFEEEPKTIAQLYDELLDSSNFKAITKESLNTTDRVISGYKGSTLDINNWTLYKNDQFLNGGNYEGLVGINQFEKTNTFRIPDNYNDFEIREFM